MKRTLVIMSLILIVIIGWGYLNIWRSPSFYTTSTQSCRSVNQVWTMEQYQDVIDSHRRPYTYDIENGKGAVLMYGSSHTKDVNSPQMRDIEKQWNDFRPTVALVEGRLGFLIPGLMNPIKRFGEMGQVSSLAKRTRIPLYSWDVSKSDLVKYSIENFSKEQVALQQILSPYFSNLRFAKPDSPEAYVEQYLSRASWVGMGDKLKSSDDIDKLWKAFFPEGPDWRGISDEWGLPGFLQSMADAQNLVRNKQLICVILDLVDKGERVFVIGGSSHAVCIEEALNFSLTVKD